MSEYTNSDLFLEPKTTQYGSHMVMSNVQKQTKVKLINVDTKFRDEYNYLQTSNYNITLPERITDVKSIIVTNIEIPITFYNISANLGNNCFKVGSTVIIIPDGQYDGPGLSTQINTLINGLNLTYIYNGTTSSFHTNAPSSTVVIEFDVNTSGQSDKYNFKSKLGWILGYRNTTYTINNSNKISEGFVDLTGPRYLYLAIDEFNKGNQNSFINPLFNSKINKNIIARITLNNTAYGFKAVLPANLFNGYLNSDVRSFTGKIDLLRFNVQLLNESGIPMQLNGIDFSFLIKVEHE